MANRAGVGCAIRWGGPHSSVSTGLSCLHVSALTIMQGATARSGPENARPKATSAPTLLHNSGAQVTPSSSRPSSIPEARASGSRDEPARRCGPASRDTVPHRRRRVDGSRGSRGGGHLACDQPSGPEPAGCHKMEPDRAKRTDGRAGPSLMRYRMAQAACGQSLRKSQERQRDTSGRGEKLRSWMARTCSRTCSRNSSGGGSSRRTPIRRGSDPARL